MIGKLIKQDFTKTKIWMLLALLIVIPLGADFLVLCDFSIRYKSFLLARAQQQGMSSWALLYKELRIIYFVQFLPVFGAIIATGLFDSEYKNNGWNLLLTYPVSRAKVFLSKYLTTVILVIAIIIVQTLGLISIGFIMNFKEKLDLSYFAKVAGFQMIAMTTGVLIHTYLSTFKKLNIPSIGIAFMAAMISNNLYYTNDSIGRVIPYNFPNFAETYASSTHILGYAASATVVLLIGFTYEFSKRKSY
jgi:hypothetical protein